MGDGFGCDSVKVPFSFTSRAARKKAPRAARAKEPPTLIRLTPAAASSSTEKVAPWRPMRTLTGLETEAQTSRMASRLGRPGA